MLKKSDQFELAVRARFVLEKASKKYDELLQELDKVESVRISDLGIAISDSLNNLNRKLSAFQAGKIELNRLIDEFSFEREILAGELKVHTNEHVQLKRFAKRLLQSIDEFISKMEGTKQGFRINSRQKSKGIAYLLWFIGGLGIVGLHRFYLGKIGTGLAWLFTGGLFYMGALYDLFALSGMVDEQNYINQLREVKHKELKEKISYKKAAPKSMSSG